MLITGSSLYASGSWAYFLYWPQLGSELSVVFNSELYKEIMLHAYYGILRQTELVNDPEFVREWLGHPEYEAS